MPESLKQQILQALTTFQHYAFMLDDWDTINRNLRVLVPECEEFLTKHGPPTSLERELMSFWSATSGRAVIFNRDGYQEVIRV